VFRVVPVIELLIYLWGRLNVHRKEGRAVARAGWIELKDLLSDKESIIRLRRRHEGLIAGLVQSRPCGGVGQVATNQVTCAALLLPDGKTMHARDRTVPGLQRVQHLRVSGAAICVRDAVKKDAPVFLSDGEAPPVDVK
jgi:hypothetical protein